MPNQMVARSTLDQLWNTAVAAVLNRVCFVCSRKISFVIVWRCIWLSFQELLIQFIEKAFSETYLIWYRAIEGLSEHNKWKRIYIQKRIF